MKIEKGKTYQTWNRTKVRIICDDMANNHNPERRFIGLASIVERGESIIAYDVEGCSEYSAYDIHSEYDPMEDLPVDTPVWVRNDSEKHWTPRYYSGKKKGGKYLTWADGRTSFTMAGIPNFGTTPWDNMTNIDPNQESK